MFRLDSTAGDLEAAFAIGRLARRHRQALLHFMTFLDPPVALDVTKPFYGLVVSYLTQLHGVVELCSRGLSMHIEKLNGTTLEAIASSDDPKVTKALARIRTGGRTGLLGDQQLASVVGGPLKVDIDLLAKSMLIDYEAALRNLNAVAAGGTLIVAWEISAPFHNQDPLWEFLRHCRNAAAHRGHFNLVNGEPRRPATWRSLRVEASLQGSRLLRDTTHAGFLDPADVIYLLADIEAAYPGIH